MTLLEVQSIYKSYGSIRALSNVSFEISSGEYVCVLGPTGAGKTTLLKIISGLIFPDSGKILLEGEDITFYPPEIRNMSYMPQGYALFPHLTVWDNVAYGVYTKNLSEKIVRDALEMVGLYHRRDSYPHELSGGQQQRIALARAIAARSKILLLDEPLSALDLLLNIELRYELKNLCKSLNLTVLHVTHNTEVALSIADKIIILRKGVIQQIGSPNEVYVRPKNLFVANFLSELNIMEGVFRGMRLGKCIVDVEKLGRINIFSEPISTWHVVVAYRPEDIYLFKEIRYSENIFKGVVQEIEFLGFITRYYVSINGLSLRIDSWYHEDEELGKGDEVYVYFPPLNGILLPYPREGILKAVSPG
ncbi:MAG TPA: ABC transporter ATP-binding protein [Thermoprotei archaeon]|nr:ABC transporter ATP-binding protein [Thermoprotei archaeon]